MNTLDPDARARYERRVRELEAFGHRGSATEHEARAARYLADELRGMGLEPVEEPFAGSGSSGAGPFLHLMLALLAAGLTWTWPAVTLGVGAFVFASMLLENALQIRVVSAVLPSRPSRNVVARFAPRGAPAHARLVVLGHYDTQRTGMMWKEGIVSRVAPVLARCPSFTQSPFFLPMLAMAAVPIAGMMGLLSSATAATAVAIPALVILGIAAVLVGDWCVGPYVPGASDNGTGTAAVLAIAESWRRDPVEGVELVALLTGCEESGLLGATAFARAHREELGQLPTRFLNIDSLGYGRPRFLGREHSLAGVPAVYPRDALELCVEVADELGLAGAGPKSLPVATDGFALLKAGVKGASVLSFEDNGHMPNYHQLTDTSDRLDFDVAWQGVRFAEALARRLAGQLG